jgi:hypothetical protein
MKAAIVTIAALGLFVAGAAAQHEGHHSDQAPAQAGMTGPNACGPMMSQMPSMMMGQTDSWKLVEELQKSLAAIEAEKDPAALKAKLAEHGALLKQLQAKVLSQSHRMEMMQHMMSGSMMGGGTTGGETKK